MMDDKAGPSGKVPTKRQRDAKKFLSQPAAIRLKQWKQFIPYLYDYVYSHSLTWPSLTVQWLPVQAQVEIVNDANYNMYQLVIATHASTPENTLMIIKIGLPVHDNAKETNVGFSPRVYMKILQEINHQGEVNAARYMPQKHCIIATKTVQGDVLIFDTSKYPARPGNKDVNPTMRLKGHNKEGYGLSWNGMKPGYILSCSEDGLICMWDINTQLKEMDAINVYNGHVGVVEDVVWHKMHENEFASVGDDGMLSLWDLRNSNLKKPAEQVTVSQQPVNCVRFSPFSEFILATGGDDTEVKLWDTRNLKNELHSFQNHTDEVYTVDWNPHEETVLASAGADHKINIWDLNKIGDPQSNNEGNDGPPELIFSHAGHTSRINDFTWCPTEPWLVSSISDDNIIQIWSPSEVTYNE